MKLLRKRLLKIIQIQSMMNSNEYASGNIILIETMNQLTKDYTEKQIQHLIDIFVACSRYELAFWQMSWDKSC